MRDLLFAPVILRVIRLGFKIGYTLNPEVIEASNENGSIYITVKPAGVFVNVFKQSRQCLYRMILDTDQIEPVIRDIKKKIKCKDLLEE